MAEVIREDRYIMANITNNNNKFWDIELRDDGSVLCKWGRVGESGDCLEKNFGNVGAAERFYLNKCSEKEKKGYQPLKAVATTTNVRVAPANHNLATLATQQIETCSPETAELVSYLTKANIHNILSSTTMSYDTNRGTFSTPLGIVTKDAITRARATLTIIGSYVATQDLDSPDVVPHINDYLMFIPQNIGRSRPSLQTLYPTLAEIQRQNDVLDALDASLQLVLSTPQVGVIVEETEQPKLFEVRLHSVTDGKILDKIRKKYQETRKSIHQSYALDVKKVCSVEIGSMNRDFEGDGAKLDNIWDLWHGSKKGNLLSIMAKGFIIPPSNASYCTGRMFGNGVYFSDQSTKSLNYAAGYWDGRADDNCFMFICDVAMGKFYTPPHSMSDLPKQGYDSTFAEGNKSGVMNNEMIVYRTSQVRPMYLVEFSRGGK